MANNNMADAASESVRQGYESAREYAEKGVDLAVGVSSNLREFARREPWIALAAAFAIGYTMARMMRRVSS
jgi:hypothetical protein